MALTSIGGFGISDTRSCVRNNAMMHIHGAFANQLIFTDSAVSVRGTDENGDWVCHGPPWDTGEG